MFSSQEMRVLGDDGSQKVEGPHSVNRGVTEGDGGRCGLSSS